jgi:hypothetical protein
VNLIPGTLGTGMSWPEAATMCGTTIARLALPGMIMLLILTAVDCRPPRPVLADTSGHGTRNACSCRVILLTLPW